jgi:hypothetical protein
VLGEQVPRLAGPRGHRLGDPQPEQDGHPRVGRVRYRAEQIEELPVLLRLDARLVGHRSQQPGGVVGRPAMPEERLEHEREPELGLVELDTLQPGVQGGLPGLGQPEHALIGQVLLMHVGGLDKTRAAQARQLRVDLALGQRPESSHRPVYRPEQVITGHRRDRQQPQDRVRTRRELDPHIIRI